jgi:GNAT superfamily N-acetyltransferase
MAAMRHLIDTPHPGEAAALAELQLRTWLETYPNPEAGIDAAWINEHIGPVTAPAGVERWRAVIQEAHDRPQRMFCRTVRARDGGSGVAGFLCGLREPDPDGERASEPARVRKAAPGAQPRADTSARPMARPAPKPGGSPGANVVTLGPMYLLRELRDLGVGSLLMADFLAWSGSDPARLWVTSYNTAAIRFYTRHGFRPTGERELWRGRLPNLRMARAVPPGAPVPPER